eukprot:TRINITY_DN66991_c2_g2_i1.p1 TRINITY_DN66991_c2_g2~~TRINITY_DN66991_c2_g2_i1.p1  ORF type:complete len:447 (-),score=38.51 TRINITY_DN66991_c2_g2_i1:1066-2367(-)
MSHPIRVGILGATGLVGRACANALANGKLSRHFSIAMVAGSPGSDGKNFKSTWIEKENNLMAHYGADMWHPTEPHPNIPVSLNVVPFEEMLAAKDELDFVLSSIPARAGHLEDALLHAGHKVFSNSPYRRYDEDVPLTVLEVNGCDLPGFSELTYVKSPNCVSNGVSLVLKAIQDTFGLEAASITTFQSLSGRGDLKYSTDLVNHNVYPIGKTEENTEHYIHTELKKLFQDTPPFKVSVSCQRVFVQKGHYVDLRLCVKRKNLHQEEVVSALENWRPLQDVSGSLVATPQTPLIVNTEIGMPRPLSCAFGAEEGPSGMQVVVGNISTTDEMFDIRCSLVVDNLDRGAFGGQLQNAEFVLRQMHLKNKLKATQKPEMAFFHELETEFEDGLREVDVGSWFSAVSMANNGDTTGLLRDVSRNLQWERKELAMHAN